MADKKISALTAVADTDIGADDLLHIVDNPGGTPVNKKMTIGQLFENIPTHLAVDDITTLTAAATNLASSFVSAFDGDAFTALVDFTLDDGTDVGQIKVMYMKTIDAGGHDARVSVTSWGYSATASNQIILGELGDAVVLIWDGSNWFPISNVNCAIT
tara:strand:- start:319 stop:792 length:474 start_codon:yes stop_codon:yes gene_type:complete